MSRSAAIVVARATTLLLACAALGAAQAPAAEPLRDRLERARGLLHERKLQQAVAASESLLSDARQALAPTDTLLAAALDLATACRYRIASYDACDAYLREALDIREAALGKQSPALAPTLTELARIEKIRGRYAQGDTLVWRALALLEAGGRQESPAYARALTVQGSLEGKRSRFDRARELCERAVGLLEAHAGRDHPYLAESLYILGCIHYMQVREADAEATLSRCRELQLADPLAQASELALTLGVLGDLRTRQARFDEAIATYEQALRVVEADLAPDHPDVGIALLRLGAIYDRLEQFELAVPLLERALAVHRKVMGDSHPLVATDLGHLGGAYAELGRYAAAQHCFEEAIDILTRLVGADNPDVVYGVGNLAKVHLALGDFQHAEQLFERCIAQLRAALGENAPQTRAYMGELALIYSHQGRLTKSRRVYEQDIEQLRSAAGPRHPDLILPLINLADVERELGRLTVADSLTSVALAIGEAAFGPSSSNLIVPLQQRSQLLQDRGQSEAARLLLARARAICTATLPAEHPDAGSVESAWAELCMTQGELEDAERAGRRAAAIYTEALGEGHLLTLEARSRLARILAARGDREGSREAFAQAVASRTLFAERVFAHASEAQKARYTERVPPVDGELLSFALADGSQPALRTALDMVLRAKGTVLEAAVRERALARCSDDPELRQAAAQHTSLCSDISAFSQRQWEGIAPQVYRTRMEALISEKDSLEALLSSRCRRDPPPALAGGGKAESAGDDLVGRVAAALPPETLLCELVNFQPFRFAGTGTYRERTGKPRYAAITLDRRGHIEAVDLGESAPLDSLVLLARHQLGTALAEAYSPVLAVLEQRLTAVTGELYERLLAPLAPQLAEGTRLLVAPDGLVGLLPLEILPRPDGDYVVEHLSIAYLSTGRDLLAAEGDPAAVAGAIDAIGGQDDVGVAVVVCDPRFDAPPPPPGALPIATAAVAGEGRSSPSTLPHVTRSGIADCPASAFAPLRFARAEGEAVASALRRHGRLQVRMWSGASAREHALRSLETAPRVLHIGTHGYFCPRPAAPQEPAAGADPELPYGLNDPLLRAGLALAGANAAASHAVGPGDDDGLLTAIEIATLDLNGTELVTLSACDTGAGEVWSSEGVYGLRRAFQVAGARTLLMSQWPVPDRETFQLISDFYERWLGGTSKREALRGAALQALARARSERGCAHPVLWGAFVLVGATD